METQNPPRLTLFRKLAIYVGASALCLIAVSPLTQPCWDSWAAYSAYCFGRTVWGAQVLLLVAVLTFSIPSPLVGFSLVLLAAIVQGYAYVGVDAFWSLGSDFFDNQIAFAVILGLAATLSAALCLFWRIIWKVGLSAEAVANAGSRGQIRLRELLYIVASVCLLLALISLFSVPRVFATDQMFLLTIAFTAEAGAIAYVPFWLAIHQQIISWHWVWVVSLVLATAAISVGQQHFDMWYFGTAEFSGLLLGNVVTVAANAALLHALRLTWFHRED